MEISLNVLLNDGWRVLRAQTERTNPIALVTFVDGQAREHHVRLDLDKRMLIDAAPTKVGSNDVAKISRLIAKKRGFQRLP